MMISQLACGERLVSRGDIVTESNGVPPPSQRVEGNSCRVTLLVTQGKPQGKSLLFPVGDFVFGRGPECHVRPNSDWVSRQHCLLHVGESAISVRDLGSRNGTLVNGVLIQGETELHQGDHLQVGPLVFLVNIQNVAGPHNENGTLTTSDHEISLAETTAVEDNQPNSLRCQGSPDIRSPGS